MSPDHPPHAAEKAKRKVSYNQEVILCPDCKKRIRVNNNGLVRKHSSGKTGSPECRGSNASPAINDYLISKWAEEAEAGYDLSKLKLISRTNNLFSDQQ